MQPLIYLLRIMILIYAVVVAAVQVMPKAAAPPAPTSLRIAVVNHEVKFDRLKQGICPHESEGCGLGFDLYLSCRFLSHLTNNSLQSDQAIIQEFYETPVKALEAVRVENTLAVLYFTENYTDASVAHFALGVDADEETFDQSQMRAWLNTSVPGIAKKLYEHLQKTFRSFLEKFIVDCHFRDAVDIPIQFRDAFSGKNLSESFDFVSPGNSSRQSMSTVIATIN